MEVRVEKGESYKLDLNESRIGLRWNSFVDVDVSAFMIGDDKKLIDDDYLVFYGSKKRLRVDKNTKKLLTPLKIEPFTNWDSNIKCYESRHTDPEMSVIGSMDYDDVGTIDIDDDVFDINLSKIRSEVKEIIIAISIYDYSMFRIEDRLVENIYVRLYNSRQSEGDEMYTYRLTEDILPYASIELCRLYRNNENWMFQALGIGHIGGIEELVSKFAL